MITHYIYEIPGRKVGCCKDIEARRKKYSASQAKLLRVLEELHDMTDQEAGDWEHWWQEQLGYKRDQVHYAITMHSVQVTTPEKRQRSPESLRAAGRARMANLSSEERSALAQKAGRIGGKVRGERWLQQTTPEQRAEFASVGGRAAAALGRSGFQQMDQCPHCGLTGGRAPLHRWHFDNCPHKYA